MVQPAMVGRRQRKTRATFSLHFPRPRRWSGLSHCLSQLGLLSHRLSGLNNRTLFSIVLEAEIRVLPWSGSGKVSFRLCQWPSSCCVLTWQRPERGSKLSPTVLLSPGCSPAGAGPLFSICKWVCAFPKAPE